MSNKKILHLTHTDLRNDNRILKEISALNKLSNTDIVAFGFISKENLAVSNEVQSASIRNLTLYSNFLSFLPRVFSYFFLFLELTLRFFILALRVKPSVIHCHDTMVLPVGVLIKLFFKSKLIYDAHELESDKNGQSKLLSKLTLYMERCCWSNVDYLITVSDSILNWYNDKLGEKPSAVILNSPLIKSSSNVTSTYFHDLYKLEKDTLVFVYLGILGDGRSIEEIIDAFSRDSLKSHVVFIGFGELSDFIRDRASKQLNVHLHHSVPHEEVVNLVKSANIGLCLIENVSLSDYYSLPNKIFEYTFAGLPVLASDFPDIKKLVNEYGLGKICALDVESIYKAVHEIETGKKMRIESNLNQLSWGTQAKKLFNIYATLLNV